MTLWNNNPKIAKLLAFIPKTIFFLLLFFFLSVNNKIFAQDYGIGPGELNTTNPKIRNKVVTATVPDIWPPSAPILISPEDESLLNDGTPIFIWQQSTDNVDIHHYVLYLDEVIYFDQISTSQNSNDDYDLTYDSDSGQYSLAPNEIIDDGLHTWTIYVYDSAGNFNFSATWSFTIDTLSPNFDIDLIGEFDASISAQNIDSIPNDPIALENNSPIFVGTGEKNSSVQVTVKIPDQANKIINFVIDENGDWDFQLGILPRDQIITLDFIITDEAGNISVIVGLKIIITQKYITYPPETTTPEATPSIAPTSPQPTPIIKIPVLPPDEIIVKVINEIEKIIPEPIAQAKSIFREVIKKIIIKAIELIGPFGALATSTAIPFIGLFLLLIILGQRWTWGLVKKILQAMGLLPPNTPQGIVFDSQTNAPVPYALVVVISANKNSQQKVVKTVISDKNGIYQGIKLEKGKYFINVSHPNYKFPTSKQKPEHLTAQEFYRGEIFTYKSDIYEKLFLIPIDKIEAEKQKNNLSTKQIINAKLMLFVRKIRFVKLFWPLFLLSILITIFYPTVINFIVILFYILELTIKTTKSLKITKIVGHVLDTNQTPIEGVIVEISNLGKTELVAITTTNEQGAFTVYLNSNKFNVNTVKNGFMAVSDSSQAESIKPSGVSTKSRLEFIMQSV
ncbi:carboxypeptidase regulatory-like domain-containing protein [Candidatus Woesebacteria bacterium]|nr:carboxypeptidase regulatory-like domain-containing protein [Candidatus Woesebacteria bacterium]